MYERRIEFCLKFYFNTYSLYSHDDPALGPKVVCLMDNITMHLVFFTNLYRSREDFLRGNTFLLNGHIAYWPHLI